MEKKKKGRKVERKENWEIWFEDFSEVVIKWFPPTIYLRMKRQKSDHCKHEDTRHLPNRKTVTNKSLWGPILKRQWEKSDKWKQESISQSGWEREFEGEVIKLILTPSWPSSNRRLWEKWNFLNLRSCIGSNNKCHSISLQLRLQLFRTKNCY